MKLESVVAKAAGIALVVLAMWPEASVGQTAAGAPSAGAPDKPNWLEVLCITTVITTVFSVGGNLLQSHWLKKIERGITAPVQIPAGNKRQSIVLLGLGDTGKTSFINTLLANVIDSTRKTLKYELYEGHILVSKPEVTARGKKIQKQTTYRFYISDYVGQNIGTLISAFLWQQKEQFSPVAYGHITSLILMVDLVGGNGKGKSSPDVDRVEQHLEQWNDTALDAVWGLLRHESMQYVCLFINKLDAMPNQRGNDKLNYIKLFDSLAKKLAKRVKPEQTEIEFEVVIGSVNIGVAHVQQKLIKHSVGSDFFPVLREET